MHKVILHRTAVAALCLAVLSSIPAFAANPPAPVITGFFPSSGGAGTWITLVGSNLGSFPVPGNNATSTTSVTINGVSAPVIVDWGMTQNQPAFQPTSSQITIVAPGGGLSRGPIKVTVSQNNGSGSQAGTSAQTFWYKGDQLQLNNLVWSQAKAGQPISLKGTVTLQGSSSAPTLTGVYLVCLNAGDGSLGTNAYDIVSLPTSPNINVSKTLNPGIYELIVTASDAPALTKGFPFITVH